MNDSADRRAAFRSGAASWPIFSMGGLVGKLFKQTSIAESSGCGGPGPEGSRRVPACRRILICSNVFTRGY
jgi:hypothetical protein